MVQLFTMEACSGFIKIWTGNYCNNNTGLKYLFRGEYSITVNGTVRVCVHGVINKYGSLFYSIDQYISFILNMISICSLIITLITYFLFKELRNLPGLNLMCLASSIFTSRVCIFFFKQMTTNINFRSFSFLVKEMSSTNLDVAS